MYKLLKDIAQITMGQSPKSSCYNSNNLGLPFLQGRTTFGRLFPFYDTWTTEWNKEALPNDILFTVRAPVGDVNICQTNTAIGRGIASIRAINCDSKYLFYLLQANNKLFSSNSTGTIFESINKDSLENTQLFIHSDEEQVHIVNTIGSIDDLIEKYEEILVQLSKIKSLYYSKSIYDAKSLSKLMEYINIETGSMNLNENNPNGKYIFYTRNEGLFKADKYTHDQEGIIVAGEGNFTPKYANGKFGLHQRAYLIYSNNKLFSNKILFQIVNSNINYLNGIAVGSTVKSLRKNSFENMPFYLDGEYNLIEERLKKIHDLEDIYSKLLIRAKLLKKQHLEKYFK